MDIEIISRLKEICGDDFVVSDLSKIGNYLYDETEEYLKPEACTDVVVAKPKDSKEISELVKYDQSPDHWKIFLKYNQTA